MTTKRAIVLIGVQKTEGLDELKAVKDAVLAMRDWTVLQKFDRDLVKTITDEGGKVRIRDVEDAVKDIVERGDVEQLIIYYSGHGIVNARNEYWLLSDACDNGNEAVNVSGSAEAAEFGSIPHVIFISDACRSAANGIGQQMITGSTIFPQKFHPGLGKPVDIFYATLLGQPSYEIADAESASQKYRAVYTEALLEGLNGLHSHILEREDSAGPHYVRPRPLKKFLQTDLPIRVYQLLGPADSRSQQPDARIISDDDAWISMITRPVHPTEPPTFGPVGLQPSEELLAHADAAEFFSDLPGMVLMEAAGGLEGNPAGHTVGSVDVLASRRLDITRMRGQLRGADITAFTEIATRLSREVARNAEPTGPAHFETGSGFKLRGAKVANVIANAEDIEILGDGDLVRLCSPSHAAVSVLLILQNGTGVLMPAIDEFLGTLTFDDGSLADVALEPIDTSHRWGAFQERADELRRLRAVVAASLGMGTFRLEGRSAETMARRMQLAKGVDPSLALYAAHAYRDQGNRRRLHEMAHFMMGDLGFCLFDIALLAGHLGPASDHDATSETFPCLPLLAQTWALMPVYDLELPVGLENIVRHVLPNSLWTLFDKTGVEMLTSAIQKGNIR